MSTLKKGAWMKKCDLVFDKMQWLAVSYSEWNSVACCIVFWMRASYWTETMHIFASLDVTLRRPWYFVTTDTKHANGFNDYCCVFQKFDVAAKLNSVKSFRFLYTRRGWNTIRLCWTLMYPALSVRAHQCANTCWMCALECVSPLTLRIRQHTQRIKSNQRIANDLGGCTFLIWHVVVRRLVALCGRTLRYANVGTARAQRLTCSYILCRAVFHISTATSADDSGWVVLLHLKTYASVPHGCAYMAGKCRPLSSSHSTCIHMSTH